MNPRLEISMSLKSRVMSVLRLARRRVKVAITCPHGAFIPGAYTPDVTHVSTYSCDRCGMKVQLSTFRGEVDW
jgi:hypothetical protein